MFEELFLAKLNRGDMMSLKEFLTIITLSMMLAIFTTVAPAFADICDWDEFMAAPDEAGYIKCDKAITNAIFSIENYESMRRAMLGEHDRPEIPPRPEYHMNRKDLEALTSLTESGNHYVRHIAFRLYYLLGDDRKAIRALNVSLGKLMEKNPEYFLRSLMNMKERGEGRPYPVEGILDTFEDEVELNPSALDRMVNKRLEALDRVSNPDLRRLGEKYKARLRKK